MTRVAYLFPGQGSQQVGMGLAFSDGCDSAREVFEVAEKALGFDLASLIRAGPIETLSQTENTQPAVLAASIAAWRAIVAAGFPAADFVAGHSLGEYSALVAADAIDLADAMRVVRSRGKFMQEAVPAGTGGMAAILGLSLERVHQICAEVREQSIGTCVFPANVNSADQIVIAGHVEAVHRASDACRSGGAKRVIPLDVSAPFHSPLMAPVEPRLAAVLNSVSFRDAKVPMVTNVEAKPETRADKLRSLLVAQVTAPVRWTDVMSELIAQECDTFIEVGPGTVLTGLVRRQVPGARVFSISDPAKLAIVKAALE